MNRLNNLVKSNIFGGIKPKTTRNASSDCEPSKHLQDAICGSGEEAGKSTKITSASKASMENALKSKFAAFTTGGGSGGSPNAMKFPYTFTAKIVQFPIRHYIDNQWIWKYYFIAALVCIPIFYKISRLANSPENKAKWAAAKARENAEHAGHDEDLDDDDDSGHGGHH